MEDKKLAMAMLFDFFGDLLTEKQREYFDLYYNEDMSLSEIAAEAGISRQGVRDMLVRAETALLGFEEKTGVVARFMELRRQIGALRAELDRAAQLTDGGEASVILADVSKKLDALKG